MPASLVVDLADILALARRNALGSQLDSRSVTVRADQVKDLIPSGWLVWLHHRLANGRAIGICQAGFFGALAALRRLLRFRKRLWQPPGVGPCVLILRLEW